jgi:glycogen debranching enzyme GlgX/4-alpha-glucanotransferase
VTRAPVTGGEPEPLGVTPRGDGVNVAVFSANATAIDFCLFEGDREVRRVTLRGRTGDIFHDHVADVAPGARYGLRAHGPFLPREGHRFNPAKLLIDPYARAIDRRFSLHPAMFGYRTDAPEDALSYDDTDSAPFVPKGIVPGGVEPGSASAMAASQLATPQLRPWAHTVLYELHVRGFTVRHPAIPETMRGRFTGLAHPAAIEHLVRLGVTAVEIMPTAAWIDERLLAALGLRNYWGYNPVALMAPDPWLAPGGWDEIRATVAALTGAGIEVILDVVLNHTGEGDALGPTLSLRGLDNATYYRLPADAPWRYVDDTGCGNTLALDRPAPLRMAMDALRLWAGQTGVHGFRFDLATSVGRRATGFDPAAPLLSAIAQDPRLRELKLIAEPWDPGPGGYRLGAFPPPWAEWNDRFRDGVRRFWRGDPGQLGELATRLAGSSDVFAARRVTSRSVNFLVAHDGFTLADLVSYTHKHNAANGEHDRDGTEANFSWNNGVEGPSDDATVVAARRRDQRALLATLLLARGTPMLAMGAELGHSQDGNNNAYAQDNPTAWLDWAAADAGLLTWTRHLLRIRREYAVLHDDRFLTGRFLTGAPDDASPLPDVVWTDATGAIMTPAGWQASDGNTLVMTLAGDGEAAERASVVLHRGPASTRVVLPSPRVGHDWLLLADSACGEGADHDPPVAATVTAGPRPSPEASQDGGSRERSVTGPIIAGSTVTAAARSVLVLAEQSRQSGGRGPADPALLDRLARAAGIAPEWWDVDGKRTIVSDDTRRALLAAMRLPAGTAGEARDALRQLSEVRDRRAVPLAAVVRGGAPAVLPLGLEAGSGRRPLWLTIEREDGETQRVRIGAEDGTLAAFEAADGLPAQTWRVALPALPEGRHRVRRDDAPELVCHLTVAPRRCHLPEAIARGGRRFGIAAQLYSLRRAGDQGIGDFTTLGQLATAAGREGAATIGINPLHMLFPEQRERASPYHPSDRRFIDPIYLDVAEDDGGAGADMNADMDAVHGLPPASVDRADSVSTSDAVAYTEVWALKRAILERRFAAFTARDRDQPAMGEAFRRFTAAGGAMLHRFATFQAIAETRLGEAWQHWPAALRSAASDAVAAFGQAHADRVRFHLYLQFLADQQLGAAAATARASGLELGLFRDLAVGTAPDGAEAWSCAENLAQGAWTGAPPDPFAAEGQNWLLPPPLPLRLAQDGFASFAALLAANMRHAGVLRIDHVMGLARLFWIPDGGTGADGAYVSYPFADLVGQVALESVRAGCMVVGEDLGNVPEGLRPALAEANILGYRILLFERDGQRLKRPALYPVRAAACVTTHDLPPLAGWWEGADIEERAALGLLHSGRDEAAERAVERAALVEALVAEGCLTPPTSGAPPVAEVVAGAHAFVAASPTDLMLVQADDLAGMRRGVNMPGTDTERPNWRRRLPTPVDELLNGDTAQTILRVVRESGRHA